MEAARKVVPTDRLPAWQNRLHDWILRSDEFAALRAAERRTLQQIANQARRMPSGDLVGARGGAGLIRAIGIARSTFWRHLKRLEQLGFVVPLTRGGNRAGHTAEASTYGIPVEPGSLDHVRAARERRVAIRDGETAEGRPRYVPHTVEPGEQLMLWRTAPAPTDREDLSAQPSRPVGTGAEGPIPKRDGPRLEMTRDPCQNDTGPVSKRDTSIHTTPPKPSSKHHGGGGGVSRWKGRKKRWLVRVTTEDLADTDRLLALHTRAIDLGLSSRASDDLLIFTTLAERALRVTARDGGDATALFASLISRRHLHRCVTAEDERRAVDRLRRWSMTPHEQRCERERQAIPARRDDRDEFLE